MIMWQSSCDSHRVTCVYSLWLWRASSGMQRICTRLGEGYWAQWMSRRRSGVVYRMLASTAMQDWPVWVRSTLTTIKLTSLGKECFDQMNFDHDVECFNKVPSSVEMRSCDTLPMYVGLTFTQHSSCMTRFLVLWHSPNVCGPHLHVALILHDTLPSLVTLSQCMWASPSRSTHPAWHAS